MKHEGPSINKGRVDTKASGMKTRGPVSYPPRQENLAGSLTDLTPVNLGDRHTWTFMKLFFLCVYLKNSNDIYRKGWYFELRNKPSVRGLFLTE